MPVQEPARPEVPGRVLLAGCGRVGTLLGEHLMAAGAEVFALRRNTAVLPAAFSAVSADLTRPLPSRLPEVDAMVVTLTPGEAAGRGPDEYLAKIGNLAAALPVAPRRVVFVSSTRVFEGRADQRSLSEDDAPAPITDRGRSLHAGELLASELLAAHIVRPAGIYGPGRDMLLRRVIEGTPVEYARRTNRIHETDLVRTLEKMLLVENPPRLLHAVDQAPAALGDVVTYIAGKMGHRLPPRVEPESASGTVLSGARLLAFLGALEYPSFEVGYGPMIEAAGTGAPA